MTNVSVIKELSHHGIILCQDHIGQSGVAAVAQVEALFPLHAVLDHFLNTELLGMDAKLPDPFQVFVLPIFRPKLSLQIKGIMPHMEADILHLAALRQLKFRIPEGFIVKLIQNGNAISEDPGLLVIAVCPQLITEGPVFVQLLTASQGDLLPCSALQDALQVAHIAGTEIV